jgi:hypothetical protein
MTYNVDANHAEIRDLFRDMFCVVEDCASFGNGFPDLIIKTPRGSVFFVEVKDGSKPPSRRKLREKQVNFQARWGTTYNVVLCKDDAINLARR